jgi:hypothetical protein
VLTFAGHRGCLPTTRMAAKIKFLTSGINDISRANNQLLAEIEGIHRTMERLFQWMDAEPRRRLIVRLISDSLVLWSAFAVVYLVILTLAL